MNCHQVKKFFSPWLDGELTEGEARALSEHLAVCSHCADELEQLKMLNVALQKMRVPVEPPEGFTAQVMERLYKEVGKSRKVKASGKVIFIRDDCRNWWQKFKKNWKKSLVVAAVFMVLMVGSAGVIAKYKGSVEKVNRPVIIANKTTEATENESKQVMPSPEATENESKQVMSSSSREEKTASQDRKIDKSVDQPKNNKHEIIEGNHNNKNNQVALNELQTKPVPDNTGSEQQQVDKSKNVEVQSVPVETKVFLNEPRSVESLFLKVYVKDLNNTASELMASAKARGILYSRVNSNQEIEIFRLEVPKKMAEEFRACINNLGQVVDYKKDVRDISNEFNEKLNCYQALVSERKTVTGEKALQLDNEIKKIESELTDMDKEAREQLIMVVWLQQ